MEKKDKLKYFASYIEDQLGIIYREDTLYLLETRLTDIVKNLQLKSLDQLYTFALTNGVTGHFKQLLLDTATNNETLFFRDPATFKGIQEKVIPDLIEKNPGARYLNIWSAACSFGQEPYSLAILNEEMKAKNASIPRMLISASDISSKALNYAKNATYSQLEVQRGLKTFLMIKYFKKNAENYWELKPEIKLSVDFFEQNLLKLESLKGTFDIVLCRNVLIYQAVEQRRKIIANIAKHIRPNGYFIMGGAESLLNLSDEFTQVNHGNAAFYQKKKTA